jgi:hypothetical protein
MPGEEDQTLSIGASNDHLNSAFPPGEIQERYCAVRFIASKNILKWQKYIKQRPRFDLTLS